MQIYELILGTQKIKAAKLCNITKQNKQTTNKQTTNKTKQKHTHF